MLVAVTDHACFPSKFQTPLDRHHGNQRYAAIRSLQQNELAETTPSALKFRGYAVISSSGSGCHRRDLVGRNNSNKNNNSNNSNNNNKNKNNKNNENNKNNKNNKNNNKAMASSRPASNQRLLATGQQTTSDLPCQRSSWLLGWWRG
ncbi:unnamed protein product [Polarella glacialis]|uniref:Uncharacterized protein n=1 Tax=Polarella glacialis TaxID=89957 RepID=A0A813EF69_POLGL|nr:unnamed protein product [Polarella glacialis]